MKDDGDDQWPEPFQQRALGWGCGCALPGTGVVLLALTIALAVVLARDEELRGSLFWLILVPLVVGLVLLYVRIQRYRGPNG